MHSMGNLHTGMRKGGAILSIIYKSSCLIYESSRLIYESKIRLVKGDKL